MIGLIGELMGKRVTLALMSDPGTDPVRESDGVLLRVVGEWIVFVPEGGAERYIPTHNIAYLSPIPEDAPGR